ncbi:unnamed protein product [Pedinophyceae sp. YPF-701]|nr:unnamed protein product [Pedinophyceae sp. YPF-701]
MPAQERREAVSADPDNPLSDPRLVAVMGHVVPLFTSAAAVVVEARVHRAAAHLLLVYICASMGVSAALRGADDSLELSISVEKLEQVLQAPEIPGQGGLGPGRSGASSVPAPASLLRCLGVGGTRRLMIAGAAKMLAALAIYRLPQRPRSLDAAVGRAVRDLFVRHRGLRGRGDAGTCAACSPRGRDVDGVLRRAWLAVAPGGKDDGTTWGFVATMVEDIASAFATDDSGCTASSLRGGRGRPALDVERSVPVAAGQAQPRREVDTRLFFTSIFSGTGAFILGMEMAGMRVVQTCESDPAAREILQRQWPGADVDHSCADVRDLVLSPRSSCVVMGPPCTDLSSLGRRDGQFGAESGLLADALRAISRAVDAGHGPEWVVVEQVRSALHEGSALGAATSPVRAALGDSGCCGGPSAIQALAAALHSIGYRMVCTRAWSPDVDAGIPSNTRIAVIDAARSRCFLVSPEIRERAAGLPAGFTVPGDGAGAAATIGGDATTRTRLLGRTTGSLPMLFIASGIVHHDEHRGPEYASADDPELQEPLGGSHDPAAFAPKACAAAAASGPGDGSWTLPANTWSIAEFAAGSRTEPSAIRRHAASGLHPGGWFGGQPLTPLGRWITAEEAGGCRQPDRQTIEDWGRRLANCAAGVEPEAADALVRRVLAVLASSGAGDAQAEQ